MKRLVLSLLDSDYDRLKKVAEEDGLFRITHPNGERSLITEPKKQYQVIIGMLREYIENLIQRRG